MNHQNIRIFMAIVEQGSISGAAKALHYTHPTVSESLKQLEKELGAQLLSRGKGVRKVVLTAAGQSFLPIAQQWMEVNSRIDQFRQAQKRKVLRLAAGVAAHEYIVPQITRPSEQVMGTGGRGGVAQHPGPWPHFPCRSGTCNGEVRNSAERSILSKANQQSSKDGNRQD